MKSLGLLIPLCLSALFVTAQVSSQRCPAGTLPVGAPTCADACIQVSSIDGITTSNDNDELGEPPPGFCVPQLHNVQWFGFVAGSSDITLEIVPSNCQNGAGLQVGVYSTQDCNSFVQVSNCIPNEVTPDNPGVLNISGVLPGTVLYLVVDGNGSDICDFTTDVIQGTTGADSLSFIDTTAIRGPDTICIGEPVTFTADTVANAGLYEWTLNGSYIGAGFSQMVDLPNSGSYQICVTPSNVLADGPTVCKTVLAAEPSENLFSVTICEGNSVVFGGQALDTTGFYQFDLTSVQGCDSIVQVDLQVRAVDTLREQAYLFEGDSLLWQGQVLDSAGLYEQITLDAFGCPDLEELELTVVPPGTTILEEAICSGESFPLGDTTYTSSGIFVDTLPDAQGAVDSLVLLDLTVFPHTDTLLDVTICEGSSFVVGGTSFSSTGDFVVPLTNANGCDSIVQLTLEVIPIDTTNLSLGFCPGDTVEVGGERFDSAGLYTVRLPAASGCDSLLVADIFEYPTYEQELDSITCSGTSGTFTVDLLAQNGCDSTLIVHLTAYEPFDTIPLMRSGDTLLAPTGFGNTYQWYDCDTGEPVPGAILPFFLPPEDGSYSAELYNSEEDCFLYTECSDRTVATQEPAWPLKLSLYPNPAVGVIHLENRGAALDGRLELVLYSADGRRHIQVTWDGSGTLRLPVDHLSSGWYWVQLRGRQGVFTRKVLIVVD